MDPIHHQPQDDARCILWTGCSSDAKQYRLTEHGVRTMGQTMGHQARFRALGEAAYNLTLPRANGPQTHDD